MALMAAWIGALIGCLTLFASVAKLGVAIGELCYQLGKLLAVPLVVGYKAWSERTKA